jgi:DNA-binding NarL/FixJ family response regulator
MIWIVEDNDSFRKNIAILINQVENFSCTNTFNNSESAIAHLESELPDIILMDIGLPGMDGIEALKQIKEIAPSIKIIMLTVFDDHDKIFRAICSGADGYILKSTSVDKIIESLQEIICGGAPMSPQIAQKVLKMFAHIAAPHTGYRLTVQEKKILSLLVEGHLKKQIADLAQLSFHTIDKHMRNIYTKLNVHSRSGAIAKALKENLV